MPILELPALTGNQFDDYPLSVTHRERQRETEREREGERDRERGREGERENCRNYNIKLPRIFILSLLTVSPLHTVPQTIFMYIYICMCINIYIYIYIYILVTVR